MLLGWTSEPLEDWTTEPLEDWCLAMLGEYSWHQFYPIVGQTFVAGEAAGQTFTATQQKGEIVQC